MTRKIQNDERRGNRKVGLLHRGDGRHKQQIATAPLGKIAEALLECGYNAEQVVCYPYQEVDYLMSLLLEREVEEVLVEIKRRHRCKWIAPQERLVVGRGLRQGLEEGRQQESLLLGR